MVGPDIANNALRVTLASLDPSSESRVTAVVGSQNLEFVAGGPVLSTNRTSDGIPWTGGDLINPITSGECTSGFPVVDSSGVTYNTTAGHCGNTTFQQYGQAYGYTYQRLYVNNGVGDQQTITTYPNYARGYIWTDSSTRTKIDYQANNQYRGDNMCIDGYVTDESCGSIAATDQTKNECDQNGHNCINVKGLVWAVSNNGDYMCQPGDSGGPVYDKNTLYRDLNIRGILSGGGTVAGTGQLPDPTQCYYTMNITINFEDGVNVLVGT